ncbi:unannotated protein [freshwater metagenome]|uniref:Unannotated protein n=1 Tax=freshwater metagenome TaxID=449393 RepID=A0A6J7P5T1_9ZZZZ
MAPYVVASAAASRITNVAAFAPTFTVLATFEGQIPDTDVTQSRPYPGTPTKTFDAGIIEIAYCTVRSAQVIGPSGPAFETE